jgi:hypothetical protein
MQNMTYPLYEFEFPGKYRIDKNSYSLGILYFLAKME